jgi:uncharacterized Zn finger protein (UPF0148 family)
MNLESSSFLHSKKEYSVKAGRANFNDVTNYHEKFHTLDNIFCKDCKTPIFANTDMFDDKESRCSKCDRDMTGLTEKAKDVQKKLREANSRNHNYKPPELFI